MSAAEDRGPTRGIVPAIAGVALMIAAVLCVPSPVSTAGVRAALWVLTLAMAVGGAYLIVRHRRISAANILLAAATGVLCVVVLEVALALAGVQPLMRVVWRVPDVVPWWTLDSEKGGRIDGEKYAGPWNINAAGFPDSDSFDAETALRVPRRILLLGDSFAFGAGASGPDSIFPELLDRGLDQTVETVVWNASIPGTGQSSQYQLLQEYLPKLHPQLVIATLYRNDFGENLRPLDRFYVFEDGSWVDRYAGSELGRLRTLPPQEAYRRAFAPQSARDYLKTLRTASALAAFVRRLFSGSLAPSDGMGAGTTPGYHATERWLKSMQAVCEASGAHLVVLLIPDRADLAGPSPAYVDGLRLVSELGLKTIDVRSRLKAGDYEPPPDTHWNDRGHASVAKALTLELEATWPEAPPGDSKQ